MCVNQHYFLGNYDNIMSVHELPLCLLSSLFIFILFLFSTVRKSLLCEFIIFQYLFKGKGKVKSLNVLSFF
jgi:hypothetical protein